MQRLLNYYQSIKINKDDRVRFISYIFDTFYRPRMKLCEELGRIVTLTESDLKFLSEFTENVVKEKCGKGFGFDNDNREKREMTGSCCEYGILKYFNKEHLFDNSIVENPKERNYPDLFPLRIYCDVKGCSFDSVPLVFRESRSYICPSGKHKGKKYKCSNVICVTDNKKVWLLGIASCDILKQYSDNNLIKNVDNITKTGFYGVDKLDMLPDTWEEFGMVCEKYIVKNF